MNLVQPGVNLVLTVELVPELTMDHISVRIFRIARRYPATIMSRSW